MIRLELEVSAGFSSAGFLAAGFSGLFMAGGSFLILFSLLNEIDKYPIKIALTLD